MKGPKSCHLEAAFWNISFKEATKKQKIQKERTLIPPRPRFPAQEIRIEKLASGRCEDVHRSIIELGMVNRRALGTGPLAGYPLCPRVSELPSKGLPAMCVLFFLNYP